MYFSYIPSIIFSFFNRPLFPNLLFKQILIHYYSFVSLGAVDLDDRGSSPPPARPPARRALDDPIDLDEGPFERAGAPPRKRAAGLPAKLGLTPS